MPAISQPWSWTAVRESPVLRAAIGRAAQNAGNALAEMTGREITAGATEIAWVPLSHISLLAGDPERVVVAVYLGVGGETGGHILLALSEHMSWRLVDMLL